MRRLPGLSLLVPALVFGPLSFSPSRLLAGGGDGDSDVLLAQRKPRKPPPASTPDGDAEEPKPVDTSDDEPTDKVETFAVPAAAQSSSETDAAEAESARPKDLFYAVGLRGRWVSVPKFLLGLFTQNNVPLSSYAFGVELTRRKGDLDLLLGISFQNMSPPDGNWLGKNKEAAIDTDFIQFKGLGFVGIDLAFVWHKNFNQYIGAHYGAGLGIGFVTGRMLRTSSAGCTTSTVDNIAQCHPRGVMCTSAGCDEAGLKATEMGAGSRDIDSAATPSRFEDDHVPPVIPIINAQAGLDIHIPQVKGLEIRIEGGFFDAFFVGAAAGYLF